MNMALAEWCYALNYSHSIQVWDYTFYPKEYLYQKLENLFNKYFFKLITYIYYYIFNFNLIKNFGTKMLHGYNRKE
jgi:hypothetical protein